MSSSNLEPLNTAKAWATWMLKDLEHLNTLTVCTHLGPVSNSKVQPGSRCVHEIRAQYRSESGLRPHIPGCPSGTNKTNDYDGPGNEVEAEHGLKRTASEDPDTYKDGPKDKDSKNTFAEPEESNSGV